MVKTEIYWEGRVTLSSIKFHHTKKNNFFIDKNLQYSRNNYWKTLVTNHTNYYDGNLLLVRKFELKHDLIFDLGTIKFSDLLYQKYLKKRLTNSYGILGVQCLIFSYDKKKILIGRRKLNQFYAPGLFTVPGGMLEQSDLNLTIEDALLREVHEEVELVLEEISVIALLKEHLGYSVILLLEAKIKSRKLNALGLGDEWEGDLQWIPIDDFKNWETSNLMEGLTYFHRLKNQT